MDEDGALGHLCAAGVVFLTLVQAGRVLRQRGLPQPDLMAMLDLVALATVADVAPLVGVSPRCPPGAGRDGAQAAGGSGRAVRHRPAGRRAKRVPPGLPAGSAHQCGRARGSRRSGRAVPVLPRRVAGRSASPSAGRSEQRPPRDRGRRPPGGPVPGRGAGRCAPVLGRGRGLASRRGGHRRRARERGDRSAIRGDRCRSRHRQGQRPVGSRRRSGPRDPASGA